MRLCRRRSDAAQSHQHCLGCSDVQITGWFLSKIDQEVMGAAMKIMFMESVAWDALTRFGQGPALF